MGVDLRDLVVRRETSFKALQGKRLGIDAFNWLYQFLSIIRQPDGTPLKDSKGRVTSHLAGLFYRTCNLLEEGLLPCYVFDGVPPSFKKVIESRIERKESAERAYEAAKYFGDFERARSLASQTSRLTSEMVDDAKKLLSALGVPVIQALSEGEAQASFMCQQGDLFAVATQDYDAFLFGAPRVVRNLNVTGRRKLPHGGGYVVVKPEIIELSEVLAQLGVSREGLIMLGILTGTDYNPGGVKGVGPKTALKLVREYGVNAWRHVTAEWIIEPPVLMDFFLKPPVTKDYNLTWTSVNAGAVKDLLVKDYEFSEERISSALARINNSGQAKLGDF